jgi:DNA-binding response OmpR family regulator
MPTRQLKDPVFFKVGSSGGFPWIGDREMDAQDRPLCKLLIVDDEPKIGYLLAEYFLRKDYEVRVVQRGEEALALASTFEPDVVLLDLLMPGMSGAETLKRLRELSSSPKVIIVSAADDENVVRGALQLGAHFYLCKPIDFAQLEHLVKGFFPPAAKH